MTDASNNVSSSSSTPYAGGMEAKDEVREFLMSRRARITPDVAGIETFGDRRRVPGLRRDEVARLAGVSIDYFTRLERGNLRGVSEPILDAIWVC